MILNWIFRWLLVGPLIRLLFRIHVVGAENLPKHGAFILAAGPHRTELESLILASYLRRFWLRFYAKQEYWEKNKFLGWIMTEIGLMKLARSARHALVQQIEMGVEVLKDGGVLALYPEATRGYDEFMHRGYPGVAYISLRAGGVPIVPVGLIGMRKLQPPGKKFRPGRATIVIGEPIYPMALRSPEQHELAEKALEKVLVKPLVTKLSVEIARLSTARYSDTLLVVPGST